MQNWKWGLAVLATLIALAVFYSVGLSKNGNGVYDVETATVERGDVARIVSASGTVRARTMVEVGSQLSGQIKELYVDFNDQVQAGQVIALIDPQTFETRVAQNQADLESAKASVKVQQANIDRAQANLRQLERDYARNNTLFEQKAISRALLEDIERQLEVARADLKLAEAQLVSNKAVVSQRQAALNSAKVDLERTLIRSPIDGVVIERSVDAGQTVAASLSSPILFKIANDLSDIRIDAAIVESDIGGLDPGDAAIFSVDAYPDENFTGSIEQVRLSAEVIQNVVTYTAVIAAANPDSRLLPGMTANIEIVADKRTDVLRIADGVTRFSPPVKGPLVAQQSTGNGESEGDGAGRLGFSIDNISRTLSGLELSTERIKIIENDVRTVMEQMREQLQSPGAQFNRSGLRDRMTAAINNVLKRHLTADEFKTYEKVRTGSTSARHAAFWRMNKHDELEKVDVTLGLSDGSYVELIRGAKEGDEFVVRIQSSTY